MENKKVGYLLLIVSIFIGIIVYLYQSSLEKFVSTSCELMGHAEICAMHDTLPQQMYLSLGFIIILITIALILIFSKPEEKVIIKTIKNKTPKKVLDLSKLKPEEKIVFNIIQDNKSIFQADIIDKTQYGKAKITRIIDRLEGQGLVERKRRGMTNIVMLKD